VANMAELLQRIAWLRYSAIQERDFEGDDSELPEMLEQNLIGFSETFLAACQEEVAELIAAAKKAGKVTTMEKTENAISPEVVSTLQGHLVDTAAHHETLADAHKAAADHHTEHAAIHKALHEHFKKAAEDGGEHEEHHGMHADAHKAHMEHHEFKAAHHLAMSKAHGDHAAKCAKCAEAFADTPEKKSALAEQFKAARDAKPAIVKSAAPPVIDTANMSASEAQAYEAVKAEYFNSKEYKDKVRAALDAQTTAKLNSVASSAAVVVGIDANSENIYRVERPGMSKSGEGDEELTGAGKLFDFIK